MQLQNLDPKAKKYYVQYRIDFSEKFNSIIISSFRNQRMENYIINYDKNDKIIDNVYVSTNQDISIAQFRKEGIHYIEGFADGGQAIIMDEISYKINDEGKFETKK